MITGLDHIAIAVPDLEAAIQRFMTDFGLDYEGTQDVETAQTSTAFFPLPPTSIELVHPLNGAGPRIFSISSRDEGARENLSGESICSNTEWSICSKICSKILSRMWALASKMTFLPLIRSTV